MFKITVECTVATKEDLSHVQKAFMSLGEKLPANLEEVIQRQVSNQKRFQAAIPVEVPDEKTGGTGGTASKNVEKEEPKKAGRPAKNQTAAKKSAAKEKDGEVTQKTMQETLQKLVAIQDGGLEAAKEILSNHGVTKVGEITADSYASVVEAAEAKIAELEGSGDENENDIF